MTDETERENSALQLILQKLTLIEENQKILNDENTKRAEEIKFLAQKHSLLRLTEDDDTDHAEDTIERKHKKFPSEPRNASENFETYVGEEFPILHNAGTPSQRVFRVAGGVGAQPLTQHAVVGTTFPAKEIIRTIEILNGHDDVGV